MLTDDVAAEQANDDLRATNVRLLRTLAQERHRTERLVEALQVAVADNIRNIVFKPVSAPKADRREGAEETAVILFSDLQLAQVTASYNSDIAEQRVRRYAEKIIRLTELQRASHPVRVAKVYMLGDLIEGELIFPHQPHQIDASLYGQVALSGPRILGDFLRALLTTFERVEVVSVPGNHGDVGGAARKQYNPETNFDRLLTSIVKQVFEAAGEKRVTFRIPEGYGRSSFYAVDYVGDIGFMLWHGHQARRSSNSSHLPFYKLVLGWRAGAIPEPFSYSLCGHHHVPTMLPMGTVTHFINGTFASDSEYAVERFASNAGPRQWLLFARPGRGVTAQFLVDVEG